MLTSFVRMYLDYFVFYVCDRHNALINQVLSGKKKLGFFPSSFGALRAAKRLATPHFVRLCMTKDANAELRR